MRESDEIIFKSKTERGFQKKIVPNSVEVKERTKSFTQPSIVRELAKQTVSVLCPNHQTPKLQTELSKFSKGSAIFA